MKLDTFKPFGHWQGQGPDGGPKGALYTLEEIATRLHVKPSVVRASLTSYRRVERFTQHEPPKPRSRRYDDKYLYNLAEFKAYLIATGLLTCNSTPPPTPTTSPTPTQ
jgi:hypothetical protein